MSTQNLSNADALAGIAKTAMASASVSIDTPMNSEALAAFWKLVPIYCRLGSVVYLFRLRMINVMIYVTVRLNKYFYFILLQIIYVGIYMT